MTTPHTAAPATRHVFSPATKTSRHMPTVQPLAAHPQARHCPPVVTSTHQMGFYAPQTPIEVAVDNATLLKPHEVERFFGDTGTAAERMATGHGTLDDMRLLSAATVLLQAIDALGVVRGLAVTLSQISETLEAVGLRGGVSPQAPQHADNWHPPALRAAEMEDVRLLPRLLRFALERLSYAEYKAALHRANGWSHGTTAQPAPDVAPVPKKPHKAKKGAA